MREREELESEKVRENKLRDMQSFLPFIQVMKMRTVRTRTMKKMRDQEDLFMMKMKEKRMRRGKEMEKGTERKWKRMLLMMPTSYWMR